MTAPDSPAKASSGPLSLSLAFDLGVLAFVLLVVWSASRPDFRGGVLVLAIAVLIAALLIAVIVREHLWPRVPAVPPVSEGVPFSGTEAIDVEGAPINLGWRESWLAIGNLALLFVLLYFLGTMAGCTVFAALFFAFQPGFRWRIALPTILLIGVGTPYVLSSWLGLHLWEGVIPVIIPGWVGGAAAPPL